MTLEILAMMIGAYAIGAIPFGLVWVYVAGKGDIRRQGSGNIGATNAWRVAGKSIGLLTFLCDTLKGAGVTWLAKSSGYSTEVILGIAAATVVGHVYSIWLKGGGGKGVATTLAVMVVVSWQTALVACIGWLVMMAMFRIVSLSSLAAMVAASIGVIFLAPFPVPYLVWFLGILVIIRHRQNIRRLFTGQEKPFRKKEA